MCARGRACRHSVGMIKLAFSLASVSVAHALTCESWCMHSCLELNGSPENECGGCEPPNLCRPGEPGFGSRAYAVRCKAEQSNHWKLPVKAMSRAVAVESMAFMAPQFFNPRHLWRTLLLEPATLKRWITAQ